jgi:GMP synthase (glutamine-hydrolysing)
MDSIIVLDFGSQYSHLICRRIREENIFCELLPYNSPIADIKKLNPKGIILSGGPSSVYSEGSPKPDKAIFKSGVPILGICYGHQLLVNEFDGRIKRASRREYGYADLFIDDSSDLFKGVGGKLKCWMSHADAAEDVPEGFKVLAHTESSSSAAIANKQEGFYGIQFHPEVTHTEYGGRILKNFSHYISKAKPEWNMENFVSNSIIEIKEHVKNEKVLCAVSGGVDSTTLAVLLDKAINENLTCVFVDNGLLRKDENLFVPAVLGDKLGLNLISLDRRDEFLSRLRGIEDPEKKRRIVGEEPCIQM